MRKFLLTALAVTGLTLALMCPARAADEKSLNEKTITGEGMCAKCSLKEADECQNAIQVKEGGKKVTYYLTQNDVSKKFHENICKGKKKVTATGTVKKVKDKLELTPTKIELAKE